MAEGEGFEPPTPCGVAVFKTAALDRSATPPSVYPTAPKGRVQEVDGKP